VAIDGPFLPADSNSFNGTPIYAFARPEPRRAFA
jgi:hypothetical protein